MPYPQPEEVTVLVLAGGLGSRLRTVVPDRPKAIASIKGKPFLSYLLEHIASFGFRDIVLCVGFLSSQIEAEFGTSFQSLSIRYSKENILLGTGGAIKEALPLVKSNYLLVVNGDSFSKTNIREFWHWHFRKKSHTSILLTHVEHAEQYGLVELNQYDQILKFSEKSKQGSGWINAGTYILNYDLVNSIALSGTFSLERDIFPLWLDNHLIFGYKSIEPFIDIGTPQSYQACKNFF